MQIRLKRFRKSHAALGEPYRDGRETRNVSVLNGTYDDKGQGHDKRSTLKSGISRTSMFSAQSRKSIVSANQVAPSRNSITPVEDDGVLPLADSPGTADGRRPQSNDPSSYFECFIIILDLIGWKESTRNSTIYFSSHSLVCIIHHEF